MGFVLIFITVGKDPFIEQQVKERCGVNRTIKWQKSS